MKNGTWKLVEPPVGTKPIGYKWVYKNKYRSDGSLDKHKARIVAKGYAQKEGIDYEETFFPASKWATSVPYYLWLHKMGGKSTRRM